MKIIQNAVQLTKPYRLIITSLLLPGVFFVMQGTAMASPFGQGVYGADVPFGSNTSIAIAASGSVPITTSYSGVTSTFTGTGSHSISVTSTDVVGYQLYINSPTSTSMTNGIDTIPASSNSSAAALATNSWGYNTNGSSNFVGVSSSLVLIKDMNGPYKNGDSSSLTYGFVAANSKSSGSYTVGVTYTAVGK